MWITFQFAMNISCCALHFFLLPNWMIIWNPIRIKWPKNTISLFSNSTNQLRRRRDKTTNRLSEINGDRKKGHMKTRIAVLVFSTSIRQLCMRHVTVVIWNSQDTPSGPFFVFNNKFILYLAAAFDLIYNSGFVLSLDSLTQIMHFESWDFFFYEWPIVFFSCLKNHGKYNVLI